MNPYGKKFAEFYDKRFGVYADKSAPCLLRFFSAQPVAAPFPRVLDLGCGTGQLAFHFLEAGYPFIGVDLSEQMLTLAQERCRRHLIGGKAEFIEADISQFEIPGPFGMVVSTYNSLNHLETEGALRGCFRSVQKSLAPSGIFLFDYHTELGLTAWMGNESSNEEGESVQSRGEFNASTGKAVMRLEITVKGEVFQSVIENQTFPLRRIEEWLLDEGFQAVRFAEMTQLDKNLSDPEMEKRVVVIAS